MSSRRSELPPWRLVAGVVLISSTLEVLLVRALPGAAPVLQRTSLSRTYAALTAGDFSMNLAFASTILGLLLTAHLLAKSGRLAHLADAILILATTGLSVVFLIGGPDELSIKAYNLISLALVLALMATALSFKGLLPKLTVCAIGATFASSYYFKALPIGVNASQVLTVLMGGEALAVLGAFLAFLTFNEPRLRTFRGWFPLLGAAGLSLVFTAGYLANPWRMALAVGWVFGFALDLPFAVYPLALFLFSFTTLKLISARRPEGYGLAMILLAGRGLPLTYTTLLSVYGMALVVQGLSLGATPAPSSHEGLVEAPGELTSYEAADRR